MKDQSFKYTLPKFVSERIKWAKEETDYYDLTPLESINIIFAYDEDQLKEEYDWCVSQDWLPVSDEFEEWRDGEMKHMKQFMILHAYVNGCEVAE